MKRCMSGRREPSKIKNLNLLRKFYVLYNFVSYVDLFGIITPKIINSQPTKDKLY